ncbi:hypothetical protein [Halostella litorea]|uniref:hypothetical protein n=1 Tax=Halostella litorea TaxID=2528831 RepID=UPI00109202C0|nr:hypothetical protein [Halostella litorea]
MTDADVTERAQSKVRDALAALNEVSAAALGGDQHDRLLDAVENTEALETALTNELDQQREGQ